MAVRLCIAGATGWTGSAVARAAAEREEFTLISGVARTHAGTDLGTALGRGPMDVPLYPTVQGALDAGEVDVLIDYTSHLSVKDHVLTALQHGVAVVVGSSGLSADDFAEIDAAATTAGRGVAASGNFSITAALLQYTALLAAEHLPTWEIVEYADSAKADAPGGTARELAERLAGVHRPHLDVALADTGGVPGARGATVAATQVHSIRLPGYTLSVEAAFGLPGERLTIRHDAGPDATPYVDGTLLAAVKATQRTGLVRGLDALLFEH
ncbi:MULTISPECIES: 4-hydroxy-tetrahydrodipicolinate reductase [Streptacidiphilus]|uniref:4-hydroxy-tetrahydrodipicolinate reductase n=1 Tax=Streptacidiphilus cavernicola TaxID=3342716 RepID=A0ABV6V0T0_9ACTN|nr:4-hydroxy-tetrahydrodipicolinate reductase [Streptacidiphilus jeojiense]